MLFHFPSKIRFDKPLANLMPNGTHKRRDNHLFCFFKCHFQPQTNCILHFIAEKLKNKYKTQQSAWEFSREVTVLQIFKGQPSCLSQK